jgi:hypothetical protein
MLDNVTIDVSSYDMVKVDLVHENLKDLKQEVPLDDMMLTPTQAVSRRVLSSTTTSWWCTISIWGISFFTL